VVPAQPTAPTPQISKARPGYGAAAPPAAVGHVPGPPGGHVQSPEDETQESHRHAVARPAETRALDTRELLDIDSHTPRHPELDSEIDLH
jgi:hypothetical protein